MQPAVSYVHVCVLPTCTPLFPALWQQSAEVNSVRAAAVAELSRAQAEVWQCSVCLENLESIMTLTALEPCSHMFCTACVERVTILAVPCPKCRGVVTGSRRVYL